MDERLDRIIWLTTLALPLGAGLLIGGIFFSGLWWTVRYGLFRRRPGLWFAFSLLLRMSIFLIAFYFLLNASGKDSGALVAALLGFMLGRLLAVLLVNA